MRDRLSKNSINTDNAVIVDQAADWLLRLHEDTSNETLHKQWQEWVDERLEHQTVFNKMQKMWAVTDDLAVVLPESAYLADMQSDILVDVDVLPDHSALPTNNSIGGYFFTRAVAASIAIVFAITVTSAWIFIDQKESAATIASIHYQTTIGEHKQITLADGSLIELGAKTSIDVTLTATNRLIVLSQGEALFRVQHDPLRPFIVRFDVGSVQAIGTAFNVHKRLDDTRIFVVEGVVQVKALPAIEQQNATDSIVSPPLRHRQSGSRLHAGETISVNQHGSIGALDRSDPALEIAWTQGRLVFISASLNSVIADLNRYSNRQFSIESQTIGKLRYTGTILQSNIDDWIAALPRAFDVDILSSEKEVIIRDVIHPLK